VTQSEGDRTSAPDGPIIWIATGIIRFSDRISAARVIAWLTARKRNSDFYGYYVLGWTVLLLWLLIYAPMSGNRGLAVGSLALYRLQDMLLGTIGEAFKICLHRGSAKICEYPGSTRSKVAVVVINIMQVVIIFAIVYLVFTGRSDFRPAVPPGRFGYFYLSWNSLPPLGSGFVPKTLPARIIVTIESGVGILLIVVALSRFLGMDDKRPTIIDPPRGRPVSWAALAIITTGFIVGGVALVTGPVWWFLGTGSGIVFAGGIIALSCRILEDST
jgi:hypothetical protein